MYDKKLSHEYYENKQIWGQVPLEYQKNVLSDIQYILPKDIKSILDVGCGDGFITNKLPQDLDVLGIDWCEVALEKVLRKKLKADITNIPLDSQSFDLVMINDVIEHINDNELPKLLSEISRLAKDYILVTIPFEERLENNDTYCLNCGTRYHVNLHLRSYNMFQLLHLFDDFPQWRAVDVILSGEEYNNDYLMGESIRSYLGSVRSNDNCHCPVCGFNQNYRMSGVDVGYSFKEDQLTASIISKICPRNECIIIFKKISDLKPRNLFSVLITNNDEIKAEFNSSLGELQVSDNDISVVKNNEASVVINFDKVNYHLRRFEFTDTNNIKIPDWFIYQVYFCSKQRIYSFELLKQYLNLLLHNLFNNQQAIDLQNARAELDLLKQKKIY